jgi:sialic acid synthase SpsE
MRIIAEAGTSHGGSVTKAQEMIGMAARAGADVVKFQIVLANEIIHEKTGMVPLPGGDTPLYEIFESLEKDRSFYETLRKSCQEEGVEFLATPFGLESWLMLKNMSVSSVKIASPELNHLPLIEDVAQWFGHDKEVILSTGVSLLADMERALSFFPERKGLTLLHCITSYPAPPEEYNLNLIPLYASLFGCSVGVSDHSIEPLPVPLTAAAMGADMVEKHFCLDRKQGGLDDPIALDPQDFSIMVEKIRELEQKEPPRRMEMLHKLFEKDYILRILGTGRKTLAPSEQNNYGLTNRSVHALYDLKAGTILTEKNTALLRTEKELRPGLEPIQYKEILGHKLTRDVENGQGIIWKDLLTN